MVDFANSNLCGASAEMNDVFKKLDQAAADIESKIDEAASTAAAAFASAQTELNSLTAKLQSIEIPQLPKLNLQAEIKALSELVPGTPAYLSSLATITKEFGADLAAAGKDLDSLISSGLSAITSGGNICNVVPNIEKEAGSTNPATEKATNVLQAATPPTTETVSKVTQNATVSETVTQVKQKTESYAVTNQAPTEDRGAITVVKSDKTIKTQSGGETKVVSAGSGKTFSSDGGMVNKKTSTRASIPLAKLTSLGKDGTFGDYYTYKVTLPHEPIDKIRIFLHFADLKRTEIVPEKGSTKEKTLGTHYNSFYGLHAYAWIRTDAVSGLGQSSTGSQNIKINGKELLFSSPRPLLDHPGNIVSITNEILNQKGTYRVYGLHTPEWSHPVAAGSLFGPDTFRSDATSNKVFGGYAAVISYTYYDNYDPEPKS